jgi:hypothetical protein
MRQENVDGFAAWKLSGSSEGADPWYGDLRWDCAPR